MIIKSYGLLIFVSLWIYLVGLCVSDILVAARRWGLIFGYTDKVPSLRIKTKILYIKNGIYTIMFVDMTETQKID